MKIKKKKVFTQIIQNFSPVFGQKNAWATVSVLKPSAQVTKEVAMPQFCILFYSNYTILATQRGGPWPNAPLPKYAPDWIDESGAIKGLLACGHPRKV